MQQSWAYYVRKPSNGMWLPGLLLQWLYGLGSTLNHTGSQPYMILVRLGGVIVEGLVISSCVYTYVWETERDSKEDGPASPCTCLVYTWQDTLPHSISWTVGVQDRRAQLYKGVVKTLPWPMILGKDWLGFPALMKGKVDQQPKEDKIHWIIES